MIDRLHDRVTPKVHFITEYPRSVDLHGLPILNSCIRFEAKHLYFKQLALRTFNFKNPLLTLSKRHQLRQCLFNNSNSIRCSSSITATSYKAIEWFDLGHHVRRLLMHHVNQTDSIFECTSIYYHHINVRQKSFIIHQIVHVEEIPIFCRISQILKANQKWIIVAEKLDTLAFNENLWSYEVQYTGTLIELDLERCLEIFPYCLDMYVVGQSNYINVLTRLTKQ
jgi:hypothetical protein